MANIIMQDVPSKGIERPLANDNDVILIDFDGRILYSYSKAEFAQLEALPTIPVLKYPWIVQDGWNWTLEDAKVYVAKYGDMVIGAQYTTSNGENVAYINVQGTRIVELDVRIANYGSADNTITVDWGDGTSPTSEAGVGKNVTKTYTHTYVSGGQYAIKVSCTNQYFLISRVSPRGSLVASTRNLPYCANVLGVLFTPGSEDVIVMSGSGSTIGNMAQGIQTKAIVFSRGYQVNFGNSNWFMGMNTLKYVSFPKSFSSAAVGYNFNNNTKLMRTSLPEEVTQIKTQAFFSCISLERFIFPENVATIQAEAFKNCTCLRELRFFPTTPPTVEASSAFTSLPTSCIIYVPAGKLTDYTTATNYPDPQTYTYREMTS